MNICKNCIFWKQGKQEPGMGICFKANNGNKNPELDQAPIVDVFFGENFGCIKFESQ